MTTTRRNSNIYGQDLQRWPRNSAIHSNMIPDFETTRVRLLPLISSIFVPFSILLEVPGLTEYWYIRTNNEHQIVEFEPNPAFLEAILGISLTCAVITNICLLVRLSEKAVKKMTISCILTLTAHDILNFIAIIIFIIKTQSDDGFILGQAFWMTLCSTFASLITNVTLIMDYGLSKPSERERSGLTKKQRTLTIIIIVLLCYVAFGAIVHTYLLSLSFIDALYFTVVCIETIGFGDINPQTAGARIFSSCYTVGGILILAVAIGLIREALLEAIQLRLYTEVRRAKRKRIMRRWLGAVKWRLENADLPVWVTVGEDEGIVWPREMEIGDGRWRRMWWRWSGVTNNLFRVERRDINDGSYSMGELGQGRNRRRMRLNLRSLNEAQLQAAAMEAGAPLQDILPEHPDHSDHHNHHDYYLDGGFEPVSPTHHNLGRMIAVLGNFAYAVGAGQTPSRQALVAEDPPSPDPHRRSSRQDSPISTDLTVTELEQEEKKMSVIRIVIAFVLFFTFWLVGSAIFTVMEKWPYGLALYFCFVTFSTVGYGDPVPRTPAGRSFFVVWALLGVGTMTILVSLLADRYSERYKNIILAAESGIVTDGLGTNGTHSGDSRTPTARETSLHEKNIPANDESATTFTSEEIQSRVDALKALVVTEGPHREGKLLHVLENELQMMLTIIHRHKKQSQADLGKT